MATILENKDIFVKKLQSQHPSGLKILDVGCGRRKSPGALGIDFIADTQADIVHDLNRFPWPLEDNQFDVIIASHVLEHMKDFFKAMEEIHRIAKPKAVVKIITPYFTDSSSFRDPSHYWHLTTRTFELFDPQFSTAYFTKAKFKTLKVYVVTLKLWKYLGLQFLINITSLRFIRKFWEDYLSFIIRGKVLHAELEVLK